MRIRREGLMPSAVLSEHSACQEGKWLSLSR